MVNPREWFAPLFHTLENELSIGIITKRVSQSFRYFQIYVNREIVTKIIIKIIQRFVRRFIVNFQRSRLREEIFFFSTRKHDLGILENSEGRKFLRLGVAAPFYSIIRKKIQESDEISCQGNREAPDGTGTIEFINYEYLSSGARRS